MMRFLNIFPIVVLIFAASACQGQTENLPNHDAGQGRDSEQLMTEAKKIDPAFRNDARKLIELNKDLNNRYAMIFNTISMVKKRVPGVKQAVWDECDQFLKMDELAELLIREYARQYSHEDIKALIAFYESPVGKKFVRATKQIRLSADSVMEKYGREILANVRKTLDEAGYSR